MPYTVGIDLGTTNSAVAYFASGSIKLFRIPQLTARGSIEPLSTLPSFHYLAEHNELPGRDFVVGEWAREQGVKTPTRLIESAKSWLSNAAANRKEKILPFEAIEETRRLTPVEASASYLRHIREMWNAHFKEPLEEQEIVLTVPASFDEIARSLTVEAAKCAGFPKLTLLEEPQAAFYHWIMEHEKELAALKAGETILVCDVGGGTTDFSLIEVKALQEGIGFQRTAVGKHLLLGGDNMDVALSHYLEAQMSEKLDSTQWLTLRHQARLAKEAILSGATHYSVWIPGTGSQVVGGGKGIELTQENVESILFEGFFGLYHFDEARKITLGGGIRKMGLPFEREPSITKQAAAFLNGHLKPTYLLFNGGAMKPAVFQERMRQSIDNWFPEGDPIICLPSSSLDLAVARGAAYYGKVRRGEGIRIQGGLPRAYYLAIEDNRVITLLPRGVEEGTEMISEHRFSLLPNAPVAFQLYYSHTRLKDHPGSILAFEEEAMTPLPMIQTALRFGANQHARIPVTLSIQLTEIGTLELWLSSENTEHRWKLEFQLSGYSKEERLKDETFELSFLEPPKQVLLDAFAVGGQAQLKIVMSTLENVIGRPRVEWPPSILRALFETLIAQAEKRHLAQLYASRFWNLTGFLLRPGIGYPLDDFRVTQLWKLILADSKEKTAEDVQIQKWICYRRIAAGLSKGQQMQIFNELLPCVYDRKKQRLIVKRKGEYAYAERLRALAALELVETPLKEKLGYALVERIARGQGEACDFWALARLGGRELLYGTVANVIPRHSCEGWIARLITIADDRLAFPLICLARQIEDRALNLSSVSVDKVKNYLEKHAKGTDLTLLAQTREFTLKEQELRFGDSLPLGLQIL